MTPGTSTRLLVLGSLVLLAAACSSSGSDGTAFTIASASQDLTVDPDGRTTVITFPVDLPAGVLAANFATNGAQTATGVTVMGSTVTVTWDDRVSPSDQVRILGVPGFASGFAAVTSTDMAAPTFTATGTQNVGASLGLDEITVQFSGARVVESAAEDASNWRLEVGGETLDLTGAVLTLNTGTQELTIDLPPTANLHSSFDLTALSLMSVADVSLSASPVTGSATGDTTPPSIVGGTAVQNLPQSEFGFVVDFTFSEPMDPVFAPRTINFSAGFPVFASSVVQTSDTTLRATFTSPIVPGVDTITLSGVVDAHGNAFAGGAVSVSAGSTVANSFASSPALATVANTGGDSLTATFVQAIDPADATDPSHWSLVVDSTPVTLSSQVLSYDLMAKTLTISLLSDFQNGDAFTFEPAGGNAPLDVDGEAFGTSFTGAVSGETTPPSVVSVVQNRLLDSTGVTLDVTLSEDVDSVQAEMTGNWSVTGRTVTGASLRPSLEVVRLTLDGAAIPGDATVDASGVTDLAGNAMVAATGIAITSTDSTPPVAVAPLGQAIEGTDNDTLSISFSDDMVASEVTTAANWTFESPIGTGFDESTATITYSSSTRTATMTFGVASGFDFKADQSYSVAFSNMRDLGGNAVSSTPVTGTVVAERTLPLVEAVFVDGSFANQVHVQFNEPCDEIDDLYDATTNPTGLTFYTVRDAMGLARGTPQSVTPDADEMGVVLTFGFVVNAGVDTLDLRGVTDLAGNTIFPVSDFAITTEEAGTPVLDLGSSEFSVVTGEENDSVTVVFDRPMGRMNLLDASRYSLELSSVPVDLSSARFEFDGTDTVTIHLDQGGAPSLRTAGSYDLSVSGLFSAQGVAMSGSSAGSITAAAGSDSTSPSLAANSVRLDPTPPNTSVLIRMDEAIDPADAVNTALVTLDAVNPTAAVRVGPRVVRATFPSAAVGQTLSVTFGDLGGNSGLATLAVVAADSNGPLLASATGLAVSGVGGDEVLIAFDEPVAPATALTLSNYTISQGGSSISLLGATARYVSATNTVRILLPPTVDLDGALSLAVTVENVTDVAGNAISPAGNVTTTVGGDMTAPDFQASFVNYRQSASGTVVDVRFDEEVDVVFAADPAQYTVSGGQTVTSAQMVRGDLVRLTLSAPLTTGQTIEVTALPDHARNASGTITTTPTL